MTETATCTPVCPARKVRTTYDALGRAVTVQDESNVDPTKWNPVSFEYNEAGNVTKQTYADGKTAITAWNLAGKPTTQKQPGGDTLTYAYDPRLLLDTVESGVMAQEYFKGMLTDDQIINCQAGKSRIPKVCDKVGQTDAGDDLMVRIGLELGRRVPGSLNAIELPQVRQAIRSANVQLRTDSNGQLNSASMLHNKLVDRRLR